MKIEKGVDLRNSSFVYYQRCMRDDEEIDYRELIYDYKRCVGCGICVNICPTRALEQGPLVEIVTAGLDAPPVILDEEKCPFCGMCAAFCPYNSFKMLIGGRDFKELEEYPHLESGISVNENCLPCLLCEKVCPNEAIELELEMPKKEELVAFEEREGEIYIDEEKCNFCGICARFCDALLLIEKEPSPSAPLPFSKLLVDEDKCDYCGICEDICPEGAIKVRRRRGEAEKIEVKIKGKIRIRDEDCSRCGWCAFVCPYDAIDLKKPFEGEIRLKDIEKCDPSGCRVCRDICPSHAWYVRDNKMVVEEEVCIYCGACENACPEKVIEVRRTKVNHSPLADTPWKEEWKKSICILLSGK
ncbi:MAG: 4Fe-4S binding protein [Candidatus Methanospirareceae archaeon]